MDLGWLGAPDASATKVYGSERLQDVGRIVGDVLARYGDPADPETADLMERLDRGAKGSLVLTFGGGVNEVQRELIAMFGLACRGHPDDAGGSVAATGGTCRVPSAGAPDAAGTADAGTAAEGGTPNGSPPWRAADRGEVRAWPRRTR